MDTISRHRSPQDAPKEPFPPKRPETMPTPEEIIEAGERLAWMVEAVFPHLGPSMVEVRTVRRLVKETAAARRHQMASSRSPG